jgi:hypothetical protein
MNEELEDLGYEVKEKNINSESNDTGDFEIKYQNEKGEEATISGSMKDGEINNIQKQTAEDRRQMLELLNQSEKYQDFLDELNTESFNQTSISFNQNGNITDINIGFENENNETATITAEFENDELKEVSLEKDNEKNLLIWVFTIFLIFFFFILYIFFKRYKVRKKNFESEDILYTKPFDYKKEAEKLLREAEKLFYKKLYKDAYGVAGQALRLYLSFKYGIKKEITNDYIIKYLKQNDKKFNDIKKCFDLCSLVEFAKYKIDKNDFDEIIKISGKTITG